jgi:hypothetical protein
MLFRASALKGLSFVSSFYEDIDLYFKILHNPEIKYGFVSQILSFVRSDNKSYFTGVRDCDYIPAHRYLLTLAYGEELFSPEEFKRIRKEWREKYLSRLAHAAIAKRPSAYWDFQRNVFRLLGEKLDYRTLSGPVVKVIAEMVLNPKATIDGLRRRKRRLATQ